MLDLNPAVDDSASTGALDEGEGGRVGPNPGTYEGV